MSAAEPVGVVMRARDEAASIGRALSILRDQTVPTDPIVVDSGSSDATVAVARAAGARVFEIPSAEFTYGGALNRGAAEARSEVIVALSAHAFPPDERWVERLLEPFSDPAVACVAGNRYGPGHVPLTGAWRQDIAAARCDPAWGYTNSAGAFRAELWRERPFRADMPGTEDREWAWHWLERGRVVVIDPALAVDHDHSREGLRASYERYRREWEGYAMFLDLEPEGRADLARRWWGEQGQHRSLLRARLDPRRAARLLGAHHGRRPGGDRRR